MISLQKVCKIYGQQQTPAVDSFDLEVPRGELLVLLGESGSGKTTTLKMINRLVEPTSGKILVEGQDVRDHDAVQLRRRIGYVFQDIGLFPHMTIEENVGIVPSLLEWSEEEVRDRVDELLELVGLTPSEYRNRRPVELSGGQQQRVGVARALAARPGVFLMDEPFGALDPLTRAGLQQEFLKLHKSLGLTTVMVTHDVTEALILADRIGVMREGRLIQAGTPRELLQQPSHPYVEDLMQTPRRQLGRLEQLIEISPG